MFDDPSKTKPQEIHVKNKVDNTMWAKFQGLISQKWQNSFHQAHAENFFVSIEWKGEEEVGL